MPKPPVTPQWRDPLVTPGDCLPLGAPDWSWEGSDDLPTDDPAVRPFSLRGVEEGAHLDTPPDLTFRYDAKTQRATVLTADGRVHAISKHTQPGRTEPATTGTSDGDPRNPPPEETGSADYQSD